VSRGWKKICEHRKATPVPSHTPNVERVPHQGEGWLLILMDSRLESSSMKEATHPRRVAGLARNQLTEVRVDVGLRLRNRLATTAAD